MVKFSFAGWTFSEWVKANKSNIRLIMAGIAGLITAGIAGWTTPIGVAVGGITTAVIKLGLDSLDYWLSA